MRKRQQRLKEFKEGKKTKKESVKSAAGVLQQDDLDAISNSIQGLLKKELQKVAKQSVKDTVAQVLSGVSALVNNTTLEFQATEKSQGDSLTEEREMEATVNMPPCLHESLPSGGGVRCVFDDVSRVLTVDFTTVDTLTHQHKASVARLFEQTAYSVVCKGMLPSFPYVGGVEAYLKESDGLLGFGDPPQYKIRRYNEITMTGGWKDYQEQDGFWSMHPSQYSQYLDKHYGRDDDPLFCLPPPGELAGGDVIDVTEVVLYMLDVDIPKQLNSLNKWYNDNFKMREVLPGGDLCLMHLVS
jgi:hypothetical protein